MSWLNQNKMTRFSNAERFGFTRAWRDLGGTAESGQAGSKGCSGRPRANSASGQRALLVGNRSLARQVWHGLGADQIGKSQLWRAGAGRRGAARRHEIIKIENILEFLFEQKFES